LLLHSVTQKGKFVLRCGEDLFHRCYEKHGFSYKDPGFDWSKLKLPTNLFKVNQARKIEDLREGDISSVDTDSSGEDLSLLEQSKNSISTYPSKTSNIISETKSTNDDGPSNYAEATSNIEAAKKPSCKSSKLNIFRVSRSFILSPRKLMEREEMKKTISNSELLPNLGSSGQYSSQGYHSNSSTSVANSSTAITRRQERSPADRLLRAVDFDAIERLTVQQEDGLNPPAPTLARVTVREKRFSLFCCKWRNRYKSVFFNDGTSEYAPSKGDGKK